jgi:PAS domain S-box-containing protein
LLKEWRQWFFYRKLQCERIFMGKLYTLIVEDSKNDAAQMLEELERGDYEPISKRVHTAEALTAALADRRWDVILSNYGMTQLSGPEALHLVRQKNPHVPFIFVSSLNGEETAVRMIKAGANDYLMKCNLSGLVPAVEREMKAAQLHRIQTQAEHKMRFTAEIVESSDEAIYSIEPDGTVVTWNRAAERVYGFRAGEIIGRNVSILYPDDRLDELIDTMEKIKRGDPVGRIETGRLRKGGQLIPASVTISPMTDAEGKVTGASVITQDATVRKKDELERTELIHELTEALSRAKTLMGLLSICAHCKRIRNDQDDWQQVEAYISEHSEVEFTHGICPGCYKEAMAEISKHEPRAAVG